MTSERTTRLTIGGETFRVLIDGAASSPALLLSHSLGADLQMWDGQVAPLAEHFRVIRYDSRGHGGSLASEGPYTIGQLGRDALAVLDALEVPKAHVLGLSMGGVVATWLLVNAPERIDRAILANTAARLGTPETWNARIRSVLSAGMKEVAKATMERWFTRDFAARDPERVAAIRATLLQSPPAGYAACCAALRDMDLREALHGIAHPVLVVSGADDLSIPEAATVDLAGRIAGARHVVLLASHLSNIEAQNAFNEAVVDFLTAKLPVRSSGVRRRGPSAAQRRPRARPSATVRRPVATPTAKTPKAKPRVKSTDTARRRPAQKTKVSRAPARKAAAVKASPKAAKTAVAKTRTRKAPAKAPPRRRVASSVAARATKAKASPKKKASAKKVAPKKNPRKPPLPRRKATTRPRRPTGRRK